MTAEKDKAALPERAGAFFRKHGVLSAVCIAVAVACALGLTLWFEVFSGLSSSADFIYSQF